MRLRNTVDEFWRVHAGKVDVFDGTLDDYHQLMKQPVASPSDKAAASAASSSAVSAQPPVDRRIQRQQSAQLRQLLAPLKKQLESLEKRLATRQAALAQTEAQLADPLLYEAAGKQRLQILLAEQGELRKRIDDDENEWLLLQEQLEQRERELSGA